MSASKAQALGGIRTTTVTEIDFAPRRGMHGVSAMGDETELTEVTEVDSSPDVFAKDFPYEVEKVESRFSA